MPWAARMSRTEPCMLGSTRRIATVVISVAEATSARSRTCNPGAPPVPKINREWKRSPASINGSSATLATLDRREDLHTVPLMQLPGPPSAARYDFLVHGDRDSTPSGTQGRDQVSDSRRPRHLPRRAVHGHADMVIHHADPP